MNKLRLIELFAGYGSQAMALKRAGVPFEHYKVIEFDKYAIKSYNAVHGTNFPPLDITTISAQDLEIVDTDKFTYLMTYSFPCTDLSIAGKMQGMSKGSGTRSGLLWQVERILNECSELPQFLLMENVTQVHGKKNKQDFDNWISYLESKGYTSKYQDLNATDYGVAQSRNRCFMISYLDKRYNFEFPDPIPLKTCVKDYLEESVEDKYYINSQKAQDLIDKLSKEKTGAYAATNKLIMLGLMQRGKFEYINRVYSPYGSCPTINTCSGGDRQPKIFDSESFKIRKLTPLECFRLMGVTDEDAYKMLAANSNSQCYKQAGNSIVVDIMTEIFKRLFIDQSDQLKGQMSIFDFI